MLMLCCVKVSSLCIVNFNSLYCFKVNTPSCCVKSSKLCYCFDVNILSYCIEVNSLSYCVKINSLHCCLKVNSLSYVNDNTLYFVKIMAYAVACWLNVLCKLA